MNYVEVDPLPGPTDDWSPILRALRRGAFFVTTGEILITEEAVEGTGARRTFSADLEWTFPLEFLELVWGDGEVVGRGHNRRVQDRSTIHHAEMNCLENAGRRSAADYRRATLYSTLSPCDMCSGAVLLYKIPRVVVGENVTFQGPEAHLRDRGVVLDVRNDATCIGLMRSFIADRPHLWNEDIGV